jgi:hypothetical protein
MGYSNVPINGGQDTAVKLPEATMGEILKETSAMAADALAIARRISDFMIAGHVDDSEKSAEPRCFREEMLHTRYALFQLNNELASLASQLGLM